MKRICSLGFTTLLAWNMFAPCVSADNTLTIDASRPGPRLNATQYGVFFEEINRAGDGGLYAELVKNRSFEDSVNAPVDWSFYKIGLATGSMALDTNKPLNNAQHHALRIDLNNPGGTVGVANSGFWGIDLRKDVEYRLSLFARSGLGEGGTVTAKLQDSDGSVTYAAEQVSNLSADWRKFSVSIRPNGSVHKGRLVIEVAGNRAGAVWLDMVSLFPPTWKGRSNGLRPDLAQAIADMKPSFLRFPGGSFVSEKRVEFRPKWKSEIGPIEERPGHPAPGQVHTWNYRSSDGLGYHEYLQFAEDLGAAPVFCSNGGVSDENSIPRDQLGAWVQDILDAIEYANGPATSDWGARRAANGHPEPFRLKYVQMGNENWKAPYHENYQAFLKAIKAKYPEIQIIWSGNWQGAQNNPFGYEWNGVMPAGSTADIIDEHFYYDAKWMMANVHRFDAKNYPRTAPNAAKIFIGEVQAGLNQLEGSLGEAAFLLGAEKNSDKVVMACYAPLMGNVNAMNWQGAIYFDNHRLNLSPAYHVQVMLAENVGNVNLAIEGLAGLMDSTVFANATLEERSGDILVKIVNANASPTDIAIQLKGLPAAPREVVATELASTDKNAGNSFDKPANVAPTTKTIRDAKLPLAYTLAPNSFTVLRFIGPQKSNATIER